MDPAGEMISLICFSIEAEKMMPRVEDEWTDWESKEEDWLDWDYEGP